MKPYRIISGVVACVITASILALPSLGSGFKRAIDVFWVFVVEDTTY